MNEPEYITVAEASKLSTLCPDNIRKLAKQDGFPCVKIGRRYVIEKWAFYEWLETHYGKEVVIP